MAQCVGHKNKGVHVIPTSAQRVWTGVLFCVVLGTGCSLESTVKKSTLDDEPESALDSGSPDTGDPWPEYETACGVLPAPEPEPSVFDSEISFETVSLTESWGTCSIVEDLDLDGWPDIALITSAPLQLLVFYNDQEGGWEFQSFPIDVHAPMVSQCTLADLHQDGDWDIVYGTNQGLNAFIAEGPRSYREQANIYTFPPDLTGGFHLTTMVSWMDLDAEGPLDMVIGIMGGIVDVCSGGALPVVDESGLSFYSDDFVEGGVVCAVGTEDGQFVPAPDGLCPNPILEGRTPSPWTASVADLDGDGRTDLYLGSSFTHGRLLRGQSGGGLVAMETSGVEVYSHAMGSVIADFDGDGIRDIFVTDVGPSELYSSLGCFEFYMNGLASGLHDITYGTFTWGAGGGDFDRNGATDVFVTNNVEASMLPFYAAVCLGVGGELDLPKNMLLLNNGTSDFDRVSLPSFPPIDSSNPLEPQAINQGDFDRDGDLDLLISNAEGAGLLMNTSTITGHWFRARVIDTNGLPAYGARVRLRQRDEPGTERLAELFPGVALNGHSELVADFGLGDRDGDVRLSIRWPDGTESQHGPYPVDQQVEILR